MIDNMIYFINHNFFDQLYSTEPHSTSTHFYNENNRILPDNLEEICFHFTQVTEAPPNITNQSFSVKGTGNSTAAGDYTLIVTATGVNNPCHPCEPSEAYDLQLLFGGTNFSSNIAYDIKLASIFNYTYDPITKTVSFVGQATDEAIKDAVFNVFTGMESTDVVNVTQGSASLYNDTISINFNDPCEPSCNRITF